MSLLPPLSCAGRSCFVRQLSWFRGWDGDGNGDGDGDGDGHGDRDSDRDRDGDGLNGGKVRSSGVVKQKSVRGRLLMRVIKDAKGRLQRSGKCRSVVERGDWKRGVEGGLGIGN